MNYRHLTWLTALALCGCNDKASRPETAEAAPPEPLKWLADANPDKDAKSAIAAKDFRLLAISGRGLMLPGITESDKEKAKQQCGIRYMEGMGDVIKDKQYKQWWDKGKQYAQSYNTLVSAYCVK